MLGENIKKIREHKNIGINKLGRITGIAPSYLSALENNKKSNPSQDIISRIASALEVPASLLYSDNAILDKIVDKLMDISSFDGLGMSDMSVKAQKQTLKEILENDPSIYYQLNSNDQAKLIACESPEVYGVNSNQQAEFEAPTEYKYLYESLPLEGQKEIDTFMEYIKHKYNVKE